MQIFHPDSRFSQFIYTVTDYMKLGLLFLLFSLPGITAGAAAAAVMTVGMRIERGEAPTIFRPFWKAFRDNFRQGTGLTLIFMILIAFLAADWYVLSGMEASGQLRLLSAVIFVLALLIGMAMLWVFPTLARFILTNRQIVHNALIYLFGNFPGTLLALAVIVGGFAAAAMFPQSLLIVVFFVPAFAIWFMSRMCVKTFRRHDGSAAETEEEEEAGRRTEAGDAGSAARRIEAV